MLVKYTDPMTINRPISDLITVSKPFAKPKLIKLRSLFKKIDEETPVIALIIRQNSATKISDLLFLKSSAKRRLRVPFFAFGRGPIGLPLRPARIGKGLLIVVTYLVLRVKKFLINYV